MSFKIVAITDRARCSEELPTRVAALCAAGIDQVIVREKDLFEHDYRMLMHKIIEVLPAHQRALLTVNTFVDTARELDIPSIQIAFSQLKAHPALVSEFPCVGVSVHSLEEALTAQELGADRLIAGHIFPTDCKAGLDPRGLDFLHEICVATTLPVYGIGGIDEDTIESVKQTGAAGACFMSSMMTCGNVKEKLQRLRGRIV